MGPGIMPYWDAGTRQDLCCMVFSRIWTTRGASSSHTTIPSIRHLSLSVGSVAVFTIIYGDSVLLAPEPGPYP